MKSPRLHDTTIADTMLVQVDTSPFCQKPLWDLDADEPGYSTDVLTVQLTTLANQADPTNYSVGLPIYYPSVSGVDQAMITPAQLASYNDPNREGGRPLHQLGDPVELGHQGRPGYGRGHQFDQRPVLR